MRLPRIRFTVRRMMALVFVLGVVLHLGTTAWRVNRSRGQHLHTGLQDGIPIPTKVTFWRLRPFWPTCGRALVGLSWKDWRPGRPLCCQSKDGLLEETCELANPEIRKTISPSSFSVMHTKKQMDLYVLLARRNGRNVSYDKDGNYVHRLP